MKRINVLSLFDGLACGMLAFQKAGIRVDNYYAYEIDKYAIKTSQHNFPKIKQCGDVFKADFTKYRGIDYLIGGSPCTYWSCAQSPDKRETTASGIGWELFSQYVRALHEAEPKFFVYENNKSMAKAIRESITETFGFDPICINSALVSAQNRQRLYWVGKRNEDGTYSKVDVQQPKDRGILLKDILDGADLTNCDKAYCLTSSYDGACAWNTIERHQRSMVVEPVGTTKDGKAYCLSAGYSNGSGEKIGNYAAHTLQKGCKSMVAEPVNVTTDGKAQCLRATCYKDTVRNIAGNDIDKKTGVAEPVCIASRGRYSDTDSRSSKTDAPTYQHYEARTDSKTNAVTTVSKDNLIGEPVCMRYERSERAKQLRKDYESGAIKHGYHEYHELQPRTDGKSNTLSTVQKDNPICEPVRCFTLPREDGVQTQSKQYRVYSIPIEFDNDIPVKAVSGADGKTYTVYEVKDGTITIKGKTYPIKLIDGYYIIRKLTVSECKRLQTVPEWYEFPVSNTRAYSMLGNGWTVDVIVHLLRATQEGKTEAKKLTLEVQKMGLTEKSMLERWEMAKIEARLDKAKSIKQQKVCCISNTTDDEAQTTDAEPVKHAYWEEKQDMNGDTYYHCTNCKEDFALLEGTPKDNLYYYCPYCGAKMDLKEGESE